MATDNLKIAEQLKNIQIEIAAAIEAQNKFLTSQSSIVRQIADIYANITPDNQVDKIEQLKKAMEQTGEAAKKAGDMGQISLKDLNDVIDQGAEKQKNLTQETNKTVSTLAKLGSLGGAFDGFISGLNFSVRSSKMFVNWLKQISKGVLALGASIISAPFAILGNLINEASQGGGSSELRQVLEDIRKEFGNLRKTAGGETIQIARDIRRNLGETGLNTRRIYGNLAETLRFVFETAKNMGAVFEQVAGQLRGAAARDFADYVKGLGLTEQGQRALGEASYALGIEMTELGRQIASSSLQMGEMFGISAKRISRDVGDMMADFRNFGNLAPQVLVNISVYARKLGVDLKGLLGVVDRFDNFEDAARGAAQLTQAFGLQLDALELMKAQDPAERVEMLRKSFFSAGRSIENMTRQERNLLAQQTGLEDSALRLVFAQKNQGVSYADITRKGNAAQKSQMTQAEALSKLADQIERMVKSGSSMQGGFWERFMLGFDRGIKRSREFRRLMINLRRALRATYRMGVQVGRAFVEMFPGVKKVFGGLAEFFAPGRFQNLLGGIKQAFLSFFRDLAGSGGRFSFPRFMENLRKAFFNYFNSNSTSGKQVLTGIKQFFKAFASIFAGGLNYAMRGLTTGLRFIIDLLSGRRSISGLAQSGSGAASFVMSLIEPIAEAFMDAWPALWQAIKDLFMMAFRKVSEFLISNGRTIALAFFGPAIFSALAKSIITSLAGAVAGKFVNAISSVFSPRNRQAMNALNNGLGEMAQQANANVGSSAGAAVGGVAQVNESAKRFGLRDAAMLGVKLVAIAAAVSVGMVMFAASLVAVVAITNRLSIEEIGKGFLVMSAGLLGMIGTLGVVKLLERVKVSPSSLGQVALGLVSLGLVAGAMALTYKGLKYLLSDIKQSDIVKITGAMGAMALVYGQAFLVGLAAVGVASFITSTGGLGAAAIIAGLFVLEQITEAMADTMIVIANKINSMRLGGDFNTKLQAFLAITRATNDFARIFANITSALSSSLVDLITGSTFESRISTLVELIKTMSRQLLFVFEALKPILRQFGSDQTFVRGAQVFSSVVGGISQLINAMVAPEGMNSNIIGQLLPSEFMRMATSYFSTISAQMIGFIRTLTGVLRELTSLNITEVQSRSVEVFGQLISAVSSLIGAVNPSSMQTLFVGAFEVMDSLNPMRALRNARTGRTEQSTGIRLLGQMINTMISAITSTNLFEKIRQIISTTLSGIGSLSAEQMSGLGTVAPIITGVIDLTKSVLESVSVDMSQLTDVNPRTISTFITQMTNSIPVIFEQIKQFIPNILNSLLQVSSSIPRAGLTNVRSLVEIIGNVFTTISQIPTIVNQFGQNGEQEGNFSQAALQGRLGNIQGIINALMPTQGNGILQTMITALNGINLPRGLGNKIQMIRTSFEGIGAIAEIGNTLTTVEQNLRNLNTEALTATGQRVTALITKLNEVGDQLSRITPANINTELRRLTTEFGLGRTEHLTLNHRNFKIEINLNVHMDAEEVEKVLLERPNTRFSRIST